MLKNISGFKNTIYQRNTVNINSQIPVYHSKNDMEDKVSFSGKAGENNDPGVITKFFKNFQNPFKKQSIGVSNCKVFLADRLFVGYELHFELPRNPSDPLANATNLAKIADVHEVMAGKSNRGETVDLLMASFTYGLMGQTILRNAGKETEEIDIRLHRLADKISKHEPRFKESLEETIENKIEPIRVIYASNRPKPKHQPSKQSYQVMIVDIDRERQASEEQHRTEEWARQKGMPYIEGSLDFVNYESHKDIVKI